MQNWKHLLACAASTLLFLAGAPASAQGYPNKPVRLLVPFAAGGTGDFLGRSLALRLSESLGQPVVLDFRPGAGTTLATDVVAKSAPDGYTLLLSATTTLAINATLYSKLPYDTVKDLAPVTLVASIPNVLVANPALPANSVQELIALAKSRPGQLNYASPGAGTTPHLAGELFKTMAGVEITHIAYKGAGPAINDVLGGHVPLLFDNIPSVLPHVKAGKLKALAVASARRSPTLPDVPTFAESGLAGFEANSWWGILAPAGTPREIVARLNTEIAKVLQSAEMKERLSGVGAEPAPGTPEECAAHIRAEIAKWAKVVRDSGAKVD